MMRSCSIVLGGLVLCAPAAARGNGFSVSAQSAEALALGGAVSARPGLRSNGFYNPSGAAWLGEGLSLTAGALFVAGHFEMEDPAGGGTDRNQNNSLTIPFLYGTYMLDDLGFGQLGVTLYAGAPFGSTLEFQESWRGRHEVTSITLRVLAVNPNVVWAPREDLSFAIGPQLVRGLVELRQKVDLASDEMGVHLGGADSGVGVTASATYRPIDQLGLAVTYRSRVELVFDGAVDFQDVPQPFAAMAQDQDATASVTLPDRITLGAHYMPTRKLGVGVDLEGMMWSTVDSFAIDFEDDDLDQELPRDWHNTVTVRAGGEVRLLPELQLRAGAVYDPHVGPTDTMTPTTPDTTRISAGFGAGYTWNAFTFDAAYFYLHLIERTSSGDAFPATYRGRVHVPSVSVSYAY